ncbi:hypothetical protein JOF54_003104 [Microlunatus capsulatus]|uniref:Uncharacterized protein n=1 Tax=Microlunatus capsulatus TaxID=99117 RepID=A0ABS4ZBU5_9ACTN|nr:hypothetical protein [Microlunatus capsulatus]
MPTRLHRRPRTARVLPGAPPRTAAEGSAPADPDLAPVTLTGHPQRRRPRAALSRRLVRGRRPGRGTAILRTDRRTGTRVVP